MPAEYAFNQPEARRAEEGPREEQGSVDTRRRLPLEGTSEPWAGPWATSWSVRLPVRAEQIRIEKQTMVVEEVAVRRRQRREVRRLDESVRRERLQVETQGELEAARDSSGSPVRTSRM
jgi:uncharacterized protein (TIGR02271 family)